MSLCTCMYVSGLSVSYTCNAQATGECIKQLRPLLHHVRAPHQNMQSQLIISLHPCHNCFITGHMTSDQSFQVFCHGMEWH